MMRWMMEGSSMQAMILTLPPQALKVTRLDCGTIAPRRVNSYEGLSGTAAPEYLLRWPGFRGPA